MQSRVCPNCGLPWYSADSEGAWVCPRCNRTIPPEVKPCDPPEKKD